MYRYLLLIGLIFVINGCQQGNVLQAPTAAPQMTRALYIEPAALTLFEQQEFRLSLHNQEGTLIQSSQASWSSSNPAVASVTQGKIQAHQLGETRIEVSVNGIKQSMVVVILPEGRYATSSIQGLIWLDANHNKYKDSNEAVVANHEVFLDSNRNGRYDDGEPVQQTDTRGHYRFPYLAAGNYPLVSLMPQNYHYATQAPVVTLKQSSFSTTLVTADDDWLPHRVYPQQGFDGVVDIRIRKRDNTSIHCTGSLLYSGYHIITAAHCFDNWQAIHSILFTGSNTQRNAKNIYIHPAWNAKNNDNDIAIIELEQLAPYEAERYDIYRASDEVLKPFIRVGHGFVGLGTTGENRQQSAKLRGYNRYDDSNTYFRQSMADYHAPVDSQLSYDFDDGTEVHDAFGHYFHLRDIGFGRFEAIAAKGDSGSPAFISGQIAGISSMSIAFINQATDIDRIALNKSFGEFAVDTRASYYQSWVDKVIAQSTQQLIASEWVTVATSQHSIVNFPLQHYSK